MARDHRHPGWSCRSLLLLEQVKRMYFDVQEAVGPEEAVNRMLSTTVMAVQVGIVLAQEHPTEAAELLAELRRSDRNPGVDRKGARDLADADGQYDGGVPLQVGVLVDAASGQVVGIASQEAMRRFLERVTGKPAPEPHAGSGPGGEHFARPGVIDIPDGPELVVELDAERMRKARWN